MRLKNKLSRRTQVISAIVVALVFGCGWLAVWKWPHLKLRYSIARATPAMKTAMASRAKWLSLPDSSPSDWIPLDLRIATLSIPPPIKRIESRESTGLCIYADDLEICIPGYSLGRSISEDMKAAGDLRILGKDEHWRDVEFVEFSQAAGLASSADFRWSLSLEQVFALQQLLFFKAMGGSGTNHLYKGPDTKGVIKWVWAASNPHIEGHSSAAVYAASNDDRDSIVVWCVMKTQSADRLLPGLVASIRFPEKRYRGSAEELARHFATIVTVPPSTSHPAQP